MTAVVSTQNSTNVRKSTPPAWLRLGVRALAPVFPDTAARLATDAFFATTRSSSATAPFDPGVAGHEWSATTSRGKVVGWWWAPSGPALPGTFYLLHGWNGHSSQLAPFVAPLVATGHRVVAFDGPGHGLSEGRSASIPALADALAEVVALHGPAEGLVAHSLGAAAAALAIARGEVAPARTVLVAPAADPMTWLGRFTTWLGVDDALRARIRATMEAHARWDLDRLYVPELLAGTAGELLVVHDRGDRETPFDGAARITRAHPRARLWSTDGLGHRRILRDPAVVEGVATWLGGGALPDLPAWSCRSCGRWPVGADGRCEGCSIEHGLYAAGERRRWGKVGGPG